ncbi:MULTISPECIES: DUF2382 domain-containing protein [Streptomyces]|uniref:DUF2382 domain-containing protein n=1 Tax=Streptomyces TaxID=1883 RepID=UPI000939CF06|nr:MULTISPECIES: PRC and DUF2382 domain-containing protein [Streptomyces]MBX9427081.1 PRC and DUF2382 domain-containing protein [Streptomyces lateritius]OKJ62763.1 photosystem reaction center subunit H [Streptomyces sp. CB02261]
MIAQEQIPAVVDHPVHDAQGKKIGDAKHIYVDDVTGRPEWVTVKTGLFGTSESFVPIKDASMVDDHLEVPYPKERIKDAPHVDVDGGGHLSVTEERRLYEHYGIAWDDAWQRANQPGDGGWAHGAAGTAQRGGGDRARGLSDTSGLADRGTARTGDDAMTRSEEELHVGTEQVETGRIRLRKYVVTEEVQQTIPVRHEEVRVEREPITEANRDQAMTGPEISEAEHEVTLHEERAVVETRAVPVERVSLRTDEVVDEETVTGQVRKERIDVEADTVDDADVTGDRSERRGRTDEGRT